MCASLMLLFLIAGSEMPADLEKAFSSGQYLSMIQNIDSLLAEPVGTTMDQMARLHLWKGFALIGRGERQSARASFAVAISLDPMLDLDPRDVSPKIMTEFQAAKSATEEIEASSKEPGTYLLLSDQRPNAALKNLVFPGWGQWSMGKRTRAVSFAALGLGALGGWVASAVLEDHAREDYLEASGSDITDKYDEYNRAHKIHRALGYGVLAVWTGAIVDILISPSQDVRITATGQTVGVVFQHALP